MNLCFKLDEFILTSCRRRRHSAHATEAAGAPESQRSRAEDAQAGGTVSVHVGYGRERVSQLAGASKGGDQVEEAASREHEQQEERSGEASGECAQGE